MRFEERGAIDLNTVLLGLAVFLIVGGVAAVSFTGILNSAKDSGPKANAQNVQTMVDACHALTQDYTQCATQGALEAGSPSGLSWGTAANQVSVSSLNSTSYAITAKGTAATQEFKITKTNGASPTRSCVVKGTGGCPLSGVW